VALRVALINSHALVPVIGDLSEAWIKRRAKPTNQIGQWIFEVTIFAFAKAMSPRERGFVTTSIGQSLSSRCSIRAR